MASWDFIKEEIDKPEAPTPEPKGFRGSHDIVSSFLNFISDQPNAPGDDSIQSSWDVADVLPVEKAGMLAAGAAKAGLGALGKAGVGLVPMVMGGLKTVAKKEGASVAEKAAGELAMDEASRMARAKAMGFDTSRTWYHGTKADIDSFDKGMLGTATGAPSARKGFFFTSDPSTASDYSALAKHRDTASTIKAKKDAEAFLEAMTKEEASILAPVFGQHGVDSEIGAALRMRTNAARDISYYENSLSQLGPKASLKVREDVERALEQSRREFSQMTEAARSAGFSEDALKQLDSIGTQKAQKIQELSKLDEAVEQIGNIDPVDRAIAGDEKLKAIDKELKELYQVINAEQDPAKGWWDQSWKYQHFSGLASELEKNARARVEEITRELEHHGSNVIPSRLKMENPYVHDFEGRQYRDESYNNILKKAREMGHDGVILKNTYDPARPSNRSLMDVGVVFDPSQIRSKFAKFDPSKAGSGDISAGIAAALGLGAAASGGQDAQADEPSSDPIRRAILGK